MRTASLIGGIGLGAGLMYTFDPDRGRRRRALARDKAESLWKDSGRAVSKLSRDIVNRTRGLASETRSLVEREPVSDDILAARIRSGIGRMVTHPSAIEVGVRKGVVTLAGPVLASELEKLLAGVGSFKGVVRVQNRLDVHRHANNVPGLQGGPPRRSRLSRFELMQSNWSPAARFLTASAGAALVAYGTKQRGLLGTVSAAVGTGLLLRGVTNMELKRILGLQAERPAVDVQKTFNIHAPVADVFDFWGNFTNLPRVMSHLREVRDLGSGRLHWVASGPAGVPVEWDAEVTELVPNKVIAWRSLPGSMIDNAGITKFEQNPDGSTRLDIRLSYSPPAGAVGHVIAKLFGADPHKALNDDLVRLKSLLETGKTTAHGEKVTREQILHR